MRNGERKMRWKKCVRRMLGIMVLLSLLLEGTVIQAQEEELLYCKDSDAAMTYGYDADGVLHSVRGSVPDELDLAAVADKIEADTQVKITSVVDGVLDEEAKKKITSIKLPQSLERIGAKAFSDMPELTKVICDNVDRAVLKEIGERAFEKDAKLSLILRCDLPSSLTSIGAYAFAECGLEQLNLPDNMQELPEGAFYHCRSLNALYFPSSMATIGAYALAGTACNLVAFPTGLTTLGEGVLEDAAVVLVQIPNYLTKIPKEMLKNSTVKFVKLPKNLVSIGERAFENTQITSVELPDSVTEIAEEAFLNASELTQVSLPKTTEYTIGKRSFYGTGLREVNLSSNCTGIGEQAFMCAEDTTSSLECAYIDMPGLKSDVMLFPKTTTIYGTESSAAQAYAMTYGNPYRTMTPYQKPEVTESTEDTTATETATTTEAQQTTEAATTEAATTTEIAATTTTAPEQTKRKRTPLKNGRRYTVKGLVYQVVNKTSLCFVKTASKSIKTLNIPDEVTIKGEAYPVVSVGKKACYGYKKLSKVTVGNGVSVIKAQAFAACPKLKNVDLGMSVTSIGARCFEKDKALTLVVIQSKKLAKVGKHCMRATVHKNYMVPQGKRNAYRKLFAKAK